MLHTKIKAQIVEAMRAKDTVRLNALRQLNAQFQNEMIADSGAGEFLPDDKALAIVKRAIKQHKDSIEQFTKGGRDDLVANEKAELVILEAFVPALMSREEIKKIAKPRFESLKAAGPIDAKSSGKIVGMLMKELAGKADGADVKAVVDELIQVA